MAGRHLLWALLFFAATVNAATAGAAADPPPDLLYVEPARDDSNLVCRLRTAGLPGERILSTLRSGLDSAVQIDFEVLAGDDARLAASSILLRLSFDLWEEFYAVEQGDHRERFDSLADLQAWLAHTPWLPVTPLSVLDAATPTRVRAGLRLHTIAPATRDRVGAVIAGESDRTGRDGDEGQEASVSLGRMIRFFYRSDGGADGDVAVSTSHPFVPGGLARAAH